MTAAGVPSLTQQHAEPEEEEVPKWGVRWSSYSLWSQELPIKGKNSEPAENPYKAPN